MTNRIEKSNRPKRVPVSLVERNLKTTNLLIRIGLQTSGDMISDLIKGKSVNFNRSLLSTKNMHSTVETLKQLRGAAMKLGQLISIDDQLVLTPELSKIIKQLRSSGYSMPPRQVKKLLDKNWGPGWLKNFDNFQVYPFAAASIGQVHKAKIKNGCEVAVKIQYPDISSTIKNDLKSLRFLVNKSGFLPSGFNTDYYFKVCEDQLMAESNYRLEAENLHNYSEFLRANKYLKIPKVIEKFSTDEILTMSFEKGSELCSENLSPKLEKNKLAETLMELLLDEIFIFQFVQTDPNLANFLINYDEQKIVLLDFGSCSKVSNETRELYAQLLKVGLTLDREKIKGFLLNSGFLTREIDTESNNLINELIDTVIEELKSNEDFNFSNSKVFNLINAEQLKKFQKMIPIKLLDGDFVFIQRKILGFLLFFHSLNASVPILKILKKYNSRNKNYG
jgi:predicted unusual protein kinase regulating ubiquinone biosynthesis (AarF/ABC1/UbiB family)